jgi:hypothetical protein
LWGIENFRRRMRNEEVLIDSFMIFLRTPTCLAWMDSGDHVFEALIGYFSSRMVWQNNGLLRTVNRVFEDLMVRMLLSTFSCLILENGAAYKWKLIMGLRAR